MVTGGRRGPGQVEDEQFALPTGGAERRPDQGLTQSADRGRTPQEAGIVECHLGDGTIESRFGQPAIGLDLGQFGHGGRRYCWAMPPEKPHWADLYQEVVTSGLCTGCAACIIVCPHDVLNYNDG